MNLRNTAYVLFCILLATGSFKAAAQGDVRVQARLDATAITVGDQAHLFLEASHAPAQSRIQWAVIPDTFNNLEVIEKGKIDTLKQGNRVTYKQRLLITGFDSGSFRIPSFQFAVLPKGDMPYTLQTDSFQLIVNTVSVDTSQPFRPIKGIIEVKSSWLDYIWWIFGGIVLIALIIAVISHFTRKKPAPLVPPAPPETFHEKALRLLAELDARQLWQKGQVKEYYTILTDVVRGYLEDRFQTPAMELTTDQILDNAHRQPEMRKYYDELATLLTTADLAKFAKAQPLPHEHTAAMEDVRKFIMATRPVIIDEPQQHKTS